MTFQCETTPELTGKTLIVGNLHEADNTIAYEAFFDNEPDSDGLVKRNTDNINLIVMDIIQAHIDNEKEEQNVTN